jgi:hypothetical protein
MSGVTPGGPLSGWGRAAASVVLAVLGRPRLWSLALFAVLRLARPGWWRRWPLLPLPAPEYWRFRLITAYGGDGVGTPSAQDTVAFLRWCRRMRALRG